MSFPCSKRPPESPFRKALAEDISSVFFNLGEFADWHEIDGVDIQCLIDKDVTSKHPTNSFEGVFANTVTIYVRAMDMERPVEGELLRVDGSLHLVQSVSDEMGIYVITASENQQ